MKGIIRAGIIAAAIAVPMSAQAKTGDVVGKVYSTDILAYIDGICVPSYNIGGKTAVVIEEITPYYSYDDSKRELSASINDYYYDIEQPKRGRVGKIVGKVYETDIKTYVNDVETECFNIGGKTAVCIEDLGSFSEGDINAEYGYSKYLCNFTWNNDTREVRLNTIGKDYMSGLGITGYDYKLRNNVMTAEYDVFNPAYSSLSVMENDGKAEQNELKPLYLSIGGEETEIGLCWTAHDRDDGTAYTGYKLNDEESVKEKLQKAKGEPIAYADAKKLINDGEKYRIKDSLELKDYEVCIVECMENGKAVQHKYVVLSKVCGMVNVSDAASDYTSVELIKTGDNAFEVNVYPFGGPHGATTMTTSFDCEKLGI